MKPHHHIAVSVIFSSILFLIFKSWGLAVASLVSGIFIDIDYLIDYLKCCGLPFTIERFKWFYDQEHLMKIRLFHGWEWVIFCGVMAWFYDWNVWMVGIFLGFGQHLFFDKIYRGKPFIKYFLFWRIWRIWRIWRYNNDY